MTNTPEETPVQEVNETKNNGNDDTGCCQGITFNGIRQAQGYSLLGICRGTVYMSNVFLSTAFLYFASKQAGCLIQSSSSSSSPENDDDDYNLSSLDYEVDENCHQRVYGFTPSSLITNIAVISGLLSAFCMPLIGAILDFTPHRKTVGWMSATIVASIQLVQIATNERNWFIMAILQAIVGFIFQIQVLVIFSYLPDISRAVEEHVMVKFSGLFTLFNYTAQLTFLLIVIGISLALNLTTIATAQVSQAVSGLLLAIVGCAYVWPRFFQADVEPSRKLPEGSTSIVLAGFVQNYRTVRDMYVHYRSSLFWFNVSIMLGEAGILAVLPIAVTFSTDVLKMNSSEVGLVFVVALLGSMPGTRVQRMIYQSTDPKISWMGNFAVTGLISVIGAFVLRDEEYKFLGYVWGGLWGFCFGWYFPTKIMIFSKILPKGQDSEYSGFLVYASQILVWLPPLLFSLSVEAGLNQRLGLLSLAIFSFLAFLASMNMSSWHDMLKTAGREDELPTATVTGTGTAKIDDNLSASSLSRGKDERLDSGRDTTACTIENGDVEKQTEEVNEIVDLQA